MYLAVDHFHHLFCTLCDNKAVYLSIFANDMLLMLHTVAKNSIRELCDIFIQSLRCTNLLPCNACAIVTMAGQIKLVFHLLVVF